MLGFGLNEEIGGRLVRAADLGADAGVARLQRAIGQAGPIAPDGGAEGLAPAGVHHQVIGRLHPLHVGAELGLTAQVQREVHAQAGQVRVGIGRGVDQALKGCSPTQGEVVALGEPGLGHRAGPGGGQQSGQGAGRQTRRVHHGAGQQAGAVGGVHPQTIGLRLHGRHVGVAGHHASGVFQVALQGQHQAVAVHDAGGRRPHRGQAVQLGLQGAGLLTREQAQVVHAAGLGALHEGGQGVALGRGGGHDELAAALVRHGALLGVGVQQVAPAHTKPCFQRTGRVVQPGVDDLAVARAHTGADGGLALQHHHLAARQGQGPRHGQAHHAGSDHQHVHGFDCLAHRVRSISSFTCTAGMA